MPLWFLKSAHSRGSKIVAEQDVAGAHLHIPDLHSWQHKVNYGSWQLLSLREQHPGTHQPGSWASFVGGSGLEGSFSSTTSQLTDPSSFYTIPVWDAAPG